MPLKEIWIEEWKKVSTSLAPEHTAPPTPNCLLSKLFSPRKISLLGFII